MEKEIYMQKAIELAEEAANNGEVPVGAVIIDSKGNIIGRGRNRCEQKGATRHAEMEAIEAATEEFGDWRLSECTMFVTLEPCPMCAGAIINARIPTLVYGAKEERSGSVGSVINLFEENYGFKPKVYGGVLENKSKELLQKFFQKKREE